MKFLALLLILTSCGCDESPSEKDKQRARDYAKRYCKHNKGLLTISFSEETFSFFCVDNVSYSKLTPYNVEYYGDIEQ